MVQASYQSIDRLMLRPSVGRHDLVAHSFMVSLHSASFAKGYTFGDVSESVLYVYSNKKQTLRFMNQVRADLLNTNISPSITFHNSEGEKSNFGNIVQAY